MSPSPCALPTKVTTAFVIFVIGYPVSSFNFSKNAPLSKESCILLRISVGSIPLVMFTVYITLSTAGTIVCKGRAMTFTWVAAGAPIAEPITKSIANEKVFDDT